MPGRRTNVISPNSRSSLDLNEENTEPLFQPCSADPEHSMTASGLYTRQEFTSYPALPLQQGHVLMRGMRGHSSVTMSDNANLNNSIVYPEIRNIAMPKAQDSGLDLYTARNTGLDLQMTQDSGVELSADQLHGPDQRHGPVQHHRADQDNEPGLPHRIFWTGHQYSPFPSLSSSPALSMSCSNPPKCELSPEMSNTLQRFTIPHNCCYAAAKERLVDVVVDKVMENAAPKIIALIREEMQNRKSDLEIDTDADEETDSGEEVESDMEIDEI